MSKKEQVLVIGAGIAGIVAAKLEADKGSSVTLLDSSDEPGGLLRSVHVKGEAFDIGTHLMSETGLPELDDVLFGSLDLNEYSVRSLIEPGSYFGGVLNKKNCFIDASTLSRNVYNQGCVDLLQIHSQNQAHNLKQWYVNRYGKTFGEVIFCPVIKKMLGVDAEQLAIPIGSLLDLSRLLAFDHKVTGRLSSMSLYADILGHHKRCAGVNKYYPKKGGMGKYVSDLMKLLHRDGVCFAPRSFIKKIIHKDGWVSKVLTQNNSYLVDRVIWTVPAGMLGAYIKSDMDSVKPMFRGVYLFDFIFDEPLISGLTYVNVHDSNLKSCRVMLYDNLIEKHDNKGRCTVEVLSDEPVAENEIFLELKSIGVVAESASCTYVNTRKLSNGFPILDLEYMESSKSQMLFYDDYMKNITFLGKGADKSFFTRDVLKDVYTAIVA